MKKRRESRKKENAKIRKSERRAEIRKGGNQKIILGRVNPINASRLLEVRGQYPQKSKTTKSENTEKSENQK